MLNIAGSDTLALLDDHGHAHHIPFEGRLRLDNGLAARAALLAGRGIAAAHMWLIHDALEDGRLEPVLPACTPTPVPLHLLIVPERAAVRRVRLLIEHLVEALSRLPGMDRG